MATPFLTVRSVRARPVTLPLQRPIMSKVGLFHDWPLILIDLQTEEGVVGRSYLEPYLGNAARVIVPLTEDLGAAARGQPVAPFDALRRGVGATHLIGREGVTPIAYDNLPGYAQLTRELKTPVQLGENFYGPRQMYHAILAGAGDFVMPDMMRIGGVSGWLRAAAIAGAAGVPLSTHLYPETAAHLMRVSETAHWLEWHDWADPILQEPFRIEKGQIIVPDRPGLGIQWDEKAVERYAVR